MEAALSAFRQSLLTSWIRRVVQTLTSDQPPASLMNLTLEAVASTRDIEWGRKEEA